MSGVKQLYLVLILMGAAWGLVFTITKISVSSGHQPFGILVWQMSIMTILSGVTLLAQGRGLSLQRRDFVLYAGVAVLGTVFPNYFVYLAAAHLQAGIIVIVMALVPLFTMPVALLMGYEKMSVLRLFGVAFGAVAVGLLVGPDASLPDPSKVIYVVLAILIPFSFGVEGNFLVWAKARVKQAPPSPVKVLFGASLVGLAISLPLALTTGEFFSPLRIWSAPEWAIFAAATLNWVAYIGYVWLIDKAGPVFAAQVAYVVTAFGVFWAMLFLGETYSVYIWAALGMMVIGLLLVQPRDNADNLGDDTAEQKQA